MFTFCNRFFKNLSSAKQDIKARHHRVAQRRRGAVVLVVALSLVALLGMAGLVVDGGNMMATRRNVQNAADSAALAGAVALMKEGSAASATRDALMYARDNGLSNNGRDNTVSAHSPPVSGPYAGDPKCVQVLVQKTLPSYFIRLLIQRKPTVVAQAVATTTMGSGSVDGLIALNPTKKSSLLTTDSTKITITGGGIMVNSNAADALLVEKTSNIRAERVRVTGSAAVSPSAAVIPGPVTGTPPIADPLASLPVPDPNALGLSTYSGVDLKLDFGQLVVSPLDNTVPLSGVASQSLTGIVLRPGVYKGGIRTKDVPIVLQPGIYILDGGGMEVTGVASITGAGVMIYNTSYTDASKYGSILLDGVGSLNVSAPLFGPYKDILFFQDRANPMPVRLKASSRILALNGTFYFPSAFYEIKKDGQTLNLLATRFIVDSMAISGSGGLNVTFPPGNISNNGQVSLVD